jgi:hypothetical protein
MSERPTTVTTKRPGRPTRPAGAARAAGAQPARPAGAQPARPGSARPGTSAAPGSSGIRQSVERRSSVHLVYLRQLPAWVPPIVLAALLVAGLAVRGWIGAAALCVVAAFIGWLGYLSWPALSPPGRIGRVAVIACLLGLAVFQATR